MNILIPHDWLLEHLDTKAAPKKIQECLSLCGPSVERIYDREGESVYDIEVTTNRVDSMSVRGIAREAAVILEQFKIPAKLKPLNLPKVELETEAVKIPKVFSDARINTRTSFVVFKNVSRAATPEWMAKRLRQIELNVHDAVIDITNYITHELGHPCHAFDYDKLMNTGGEIRVVEAKKGETFSTLDGEEFTTVGGEVVFKNGEGVIIDLPSIKGTANTSIDESTQNVLLLMESIRADKVRFASMTHNIRTTAAQLMEKNVDPHLMDDVMKLGVKLYKELCAAEIASEIFDEFHDKEESIAVNLSKAKLDSYLGLSLEAKEVIDIFSSLECEAKYEESKNQFFVTAPSFRPDLKIDVDLIEEIARIYGYYKLPSVIMPGSIPTKQQTGVNFNVEDRIKHFLSNLGWQEIYSYSMVSEEIAKESGFTLDEHLSLENPLTEDRVYLRRSLIPSLVEAIENNPLEKELSVFEMANLYEPQENDLPKETMHLSLVSTNSYREVKGVIESLLEQFFIRKYEFKIIEEKSQQFSQMAEILVTENDKKIRVGKIGMLKNGMVAADIAMAKLISITKTHPKYQAIPKTSALTEQLTFTLPEKTAIGKLIATIYSVNSLIASVSLDDLYEQNASFTVSFLDTENNLSSAEVAPIRKKIVDVLQKEYEAQLVGAV